MKQQKDTLKKGYIRFIVRLIIFILLIGLFFTKILCFARVDGMQMFPSLKDGDLALCYCLPQDLRTKDIIIYEQDGENHFGRIIAMEGSEIDIDGSGGVKINGISEGGEVIYPTYRKGTINYPYQIKKDQVFVLGDYRTETKDSRTYGAVRKSQIKGKVITILRRRGL